MSSLTGHKSLTKFAVTELVRESPNDPILSNLKSADLPMHAVLRDLYDVISLGHWLNFGQKHHFMRRFDGQKPYSAYQENCEWIRTNALEAARMLHGRLRTRYGPMASQGPQRALGAPPTAQQREAGQVVFGGGEDDAVSWQEFGNACHAFQDSFAEGHAVRIPKPVSHPGWIDDILVYADDEDYKKEHHKFDEGWHVNNDQHVLSDVGEVAKDGTKTLIRMVVSTALKASGGAAPTQLDGWFPFKGHWLAASPGLVTRDPDAAIRLIRRYVTGTNNGLPVVGHITLNMDEEGLAKALYSEFGDDMRSVHAAFIELDLNRNSDSDDVGLEYVKLVRSGAASIRAAFLKDHALKRLLIKILAEGWETAEEAATVRWLYGYDGYDK